jgi:uncharacterized protein (DUF58 family)
MRSSKGFWFAAAAIICIITGLFTGSGGLVALSLPLVLYLTTLSVFRADGLCEVEIKRKLSDSRIMAGDDQVVEITVRNQGGRIEILEIVDEIPNYVKVKKGSNRVLLSLDPGEEFVFGYVLNCPMRGRFTLKTVTLRLMDMGRLHQVEQTLTLISEFSVVAKTESSKGIKIAPRKTRNWVGMIKSRRVGIGTEFYGMRDYVSGDELRKINWKASARFDALITNEFESECSGDTTLILDARLEANVGDVLDSTVEHGVRAASTIASQVLGDKNRVGLIVLRDIIDEVYPAFGKRQFYKLSEHLLDVKPIGLLPFENVGWMMTGYFPLESQIVIITALTDREIVRTIADLCSRGYDVVVISPSPLKAEESVVTDSKEMRLALRVLGLERRNLISELRRYARIVDWDTDEPLAKALKGVERSMPRR